VCIAVGSATALREGGEKMHGKRELPVDLHATADY